jgi:N-methylhydantoinase B
MIGGGWGANAAGDGQCATICINDGDTHNAPVEATENKFPSILVERYELVPDSGGPGTFRGGLGTEQAIRLTQEAVVESFIERTQCPPWGIFGGGAGRANGIRIRRGDGRAEDPPNGKIPPTRLRPGDAYVLCGGGGGGYGDPLERSPDAVRRDVECGYVSPPAARDAYGVVVDPDTLAVDPDATRELRAAGRRAGRDPRTTRA